MRFPKDKSSMVLYAISIILILYGVTGLGVLCYVYFTKMEAVNSAINSTVNQLLLTSDALKNVREYLLVSGEIKTQIEGMEYGINEIRLSIDSLSSHLNSMATSMDISIFGLRPFGSVADQMRDVASTSASMGRAIEGTSELLTMIKELKIKDILSEKYLSMMDVYSVQFVTFGNMLKQLIALIPPVLAYLATSYGMFILMGVSIVILTNMFSKTAEFKD